MCARVCDMRIIKHYGSHMRIITLYGSHMRIITFYVMYYFTKYIIIISSVIHNNNILHITKCYDNMTISFFDLYV